MPRAIKIFESDMILIDIAAQLLLLRNRKILIANEGAWHYSSKVGGY